MNVIELGYNYRLKRCDSMNWELEHFHLPIRHGKPTSDAPKWMKMGRYFQSLSGALIVVYGLVLREDEESALQIMDALDHAEKIERDLKSVAVDLTKL